MLPSDEYVYNGGGKMNKLDELEEELVTSTSMLAGLTIKNVVDTYMDSLLFTFECGKIAVLGIKYGYEGDADVVVEPEINPWEYIASFYRAGLLTEEEAEGLQAENTRRHKQRMQERDRQTYERLKAKFEGA